MTLVDKVLRELVVANRILSQQNVLDAYGHVSARHPENPQRYFLARSLSPGSVTLDDIIEFNMDGAPVAAAETRPLYVERFIHGAIYEARPEVMAVVHSHAEDVLPFTITRRKFRPVLHTIGNMGQEIPVWDIADKFGDRTPLVVTNMDQGRDLASCLGCNRLALMRTHGFVCTGVSLPDLVRLSVYVPKNARVLMAALRICTSADENEIRYLSAGEVEARAALDPNSPAMLRGWEFWAAEAGCADLLLD